MPCHDRRSMEVVASLPAEPPLGTAFVRPRFVLLAIASFTAFFVLSFAGCWLPAHHFLTPFFVIGCRHFELARYAPVHRSRWLLLLIASSLVMPLMLMLWLDPWVAVFGPRWLTLVMAMVLFAGGSHLFVMQRRLLRELIERGIQNRSQPCADWVCGGLLAIFPPMFLLGVGDVLAAWRDPLTWLPWFVGLALLVLQLRRNRLFPWLTVVCFVVWTVEGVFTWRPTRDDVSAWGIAWTFVSMNVPMPLLAAYLCFSPRVRRTFAGTRSPDQPAAAVLAAAR